MSVCASVTVADPLVRLHVSAVLCRRVVTCCRVLPSVCRAAAAAGAAALDPRVSSGWRVRKLQSKGARRQHRPWIARAGRRTRSAGTAASNHGKAIHERRRNSAGGRIRSRHWSSNTRRAAQRDGHCRHHCIIWCSGATTRRRQYHERSEGTRRHACTALCSIGSAALCQSVPLRPSLT